MRRTSISLVLAAACALFGLGTKVRAQEEPIPSAVAEQKLTATVDFGNRWVQDIGGSSDVYRSIVNLGEGPRLFGGEARYRDQGGSYLENLDVSAHAWGGDPYNTARIEGGRSNIYSFRVDYRNVAYFHSLPSFANPLLASGLLLSQRSLDITRRMIDTEVEILPNARLSPFFSFYNGAGFGRGVTTFVSDGNEFPVASHFDDDVSSYRGGVRLRLSKYNFLVEQGRTSFEDQQEIFHDGRIPGNRSTPLFGQTLALDDLSQRYDAESHGIFNRAVLQGHPSPWLTFSGQFLYSQPRVQVRYGHEAKGSLFLLREIAPFTNGMESSLGDAKRPHSSGSWNTEIRPSNRFRIVQSWYTDRFHIAGGSLLNEAFDTVPPATTETSDVNLTLVNYNQHQVDAMYDVTPRVIVRAGHRYVWGDALTRPATLQLAETPRNTGEVRRNVGLAGASVRLPSNLSLNFDFEASPGDDTFFRTGLMEYQRVKVRGRYGIRPSLTITGSFSLLKNENPAPGINFDFESRQTSLGVFWTPTNSRFSVLADYTRATVRSEIPILSLPFFGTELARYRDSGHHGSIFAGIPLVGEARLAVGGSLSINTGSRPTRFYQPEARITAPLARHVSWTAQWRWFGFEEKLFHHENFRSHLFATGLRLQM